MENSFLVLKKLSNSLGKIDGIVMYSMFQLPSDRDLRLKIFNNFKKKKKNFFRFRRQRIEYEVFRIN